MMSTHKFLTVLRSLLSAGSNAVSHELSFFLKQWRQDSRVTNSHGNQIGCSVIFQPFIFDLNYD